MCKAGYINTKDILTKSTKIPQFISFKLLNLFVQFLFLFLNFIKELLLFFPLELCNVILCEDVLICPWDLITLHRLQIMILLQVIFVWNLFVFKIQIMLRFLQILLQLLLHLLILWQIFL